MAEHFRDYLNPEIDTFAEPILHPETDRLHKTLVKAGPTLLHALGAERLDDSPEGQNWQFRTSDGRAAVLSINEPDVVIPALLRYRDVGLFYTYTAEDYPLWKPNTGRMAPPKGQEDSIDPQGDAMVTVIEALHASTRRVRKFGRVAAGVAEPVSDWLATRSSSSGTDRTKKEITAHYDLSQDVYVGEHGFLDDKYAQYSSGSLAPGRNSASLEDLQEYKVAELNRKLQLGSAETLLEVGGGWGGLAVALAERNPNLHITSLTVSEEQHKEMLRRAEAAGADVERRIDFRIQDYRDFRTEKPFDRLVSIEMLEAVHADEHQAYFNAVSRFVNKTVGVIVLQTINIKPEQFASQKRTHSFADTAIFPGGLLTPRENIEAEMARRGWSRQEYTELGPAYALTLPWWRYREVEHQPALTAKWMSQGHTPAQIGRFIRGFPGFYLPASQAGFMPSLGGHLTDSQLTFVPAK